MSKLEELDSYTNSYKTSFTYHLDNSLILNWYPKRVLELSKGNSLLELGLGHGYSSLIFSKAFKRHLILEGSPKIISTCKALKLVSPNTKVLKVFFEDMLQVLCLFEAF